MGVTLLLFFVAGLYEIGGGYFVWLWLRNGMRWIVGALGGFVLYLCGIYNCSAIALSQILHSIWWRLYRHGFSRGWIFEGIAPDRFNIIGAAIALAGVAIIFYMPRKGGESLLVGQEVIQATPSHVVTVALYLEAAVAEIGG